MVKSGQLGIFSVATGLPSDGKGAITVANSMALELEATLCSCANLGNDLASLYFSFLIYKMEIIILSTPEGCLQVKADRLIHSSVCSMRNTREMEV